MVATLLVPYLSAVVHCAILHSFKPIHMNKFERLNKLTQKKEAYIGCAGVLKTIDGEPRLNKVSQKPYYRFTAEIETPKGGLLIGGQVYQALIPFLGKTPEVGDRLDFNCKLTDLQEEQTNTRWGIGGHTVDSVDDLLGMIKDL